MERDENWKPLFLAAVVVALLEVKLPLILVHDARVQLQVRA